MTSVPAHTPPHHIIGESGIQTRSGRALGTPSSQADTNSTRASLSPRARRTARKKAAHKKSGREDEETVRLDQPLSILTRDLKIPLRDMALWVNRSAEARQAEAGKKGSEWKPPRPMNSFMLYRSAYTNRIKYLRKENNNQNVSKVAGVSWKMEPEEVRNFYVELAIQDRDNHAEAFPGYKFEPHKSEKRKRPDDKDSDSEGDSDPEWEGSFRSSKRARSARRIANRSAASTPFGDRQPLYQIPAPMPAFHPSGYEISNPYGPPTLMLGPNGMVGEYYQTSTTIGPYDHVTDVKFERLEEPFAPYQGNMGLVGMPNAAHHELLATYPPPAQAPHGMPMSTASMLDPRLGHIESNYEVVYYDGAVEATPEMPRTISYEPIAPLDMGYETVETYHPGLATLTEEHDVWGDQGHAGSDFDSEFQKLN